jgi:hypothetical protein
MHHNFATTNETAKENLLLSSSVAAINALESNREVVRAQRDLQTEINTDTTRRRQSLERNDPVEANSFALQRDNFSSSPLMVQHFFFERSH